MTNTSPGEPGEYDGPQFFTGGWEVVSLQTLHTMHDPTLLKDDVGDRGYVTISQYRFDTGERHVTGIVNSATAVADLEVRDNASGALLVHADAIEVPRIGLDSFQHREVMYRSLATLASRAVIFAEFVDDNSEEDNGCSSAA